MTNEEAINHGKEQLEIFGGEHKEFIELAIKALEQTRWIPVSERLPEEDGLYLVTDVSKYFGAYSTYVLKREKASPSNCVKWATIVAWMPLPEPYKEGNNVERDA